jgi:hypothetical protein
LRVQDVLQFSEQFQFSSFSYSFQECCDNHNRNVNKEYLNFKAKATPMPRPSDNIPICTGSNTCKFQYDENDCEDFNDSHFLSPFGYNHSPFKDLQSKGSFSGFWSRV